MTPKGDKSVVFEHTGIAKEDFITGWWGTVAMGGSEFIPGHYLCIDHNSRSVVLAIRGSSNFRDALIDMVANYIAYKDGAVHKGMFHSTKLLMEKMKEPILNALQQYPSYGLRICGHSLGAGVTSLFTLLFHEEYPDVDIHGYCYAPPCTMDQNLSLKCKGLISSYILGDDCVPRLSYGSMDELKETMKYFLANSGSGLSSRLYMVTKHWTGINSPKLARLFLVSKERAIQKLSDYKTEQRREHLYPPGSLYHMYRNNDKEADGEISDFSKFGHIVISRDMFTDHLPHNYEKILKKLSLTSQERAYNSLTPSRFSTASLAGIFRRKKKNLSSSDVIEQHLFNLESEIQNENSTHSDGTIEIDEKIIITEKDEEKEEKDDKSEKEERKRKSRLKKISPKEKIDILIKEGTITEEIDTNNEDEKDQKPIEFLRRRLSIEISQEIQLEVTPRETKPTELQTPKNDSDDDDIYDISEIDDEPLDASDLSIGSLLSLLDDGTEKSKVSKKKGRKRREKEARKAMSDKPSRLSRTAKDVGDFRKESRRHSRRASTMRRGSDQAQALLAGGNKSDNDSKVQRIKSEPRKPLKGIFNDAQKEKLDDGDDNNISDVKIVVEEREIEKEENEEENRAKEEKDYVKVVNEDEKAEEIEIEIGAEKEETDENNIKEKENDNEEVVIVATDLISDESDYSKKESGNNGDENNRIEANKKAIEENKISKRKSKSSSSKVKSEDDLISGVMKKSKRSEKGSMRKSHKDKTRSKLSLSQSSIEFHIPPESPETQRIESSKSKKKEKEGEEKNPFKNPNPVIVSKKRSSTLVGRNTSIVHDDKRKSFADFRDTFNNNQNNHSNSVKKIDFPNPDKFQELLESVPADMKAYLTNIFDSLVEKEKELAKRESELKKKDRRPSSVLPKKKG